MTEHGRIDDIKIDPTFLNSKSVFVAVSGQTPKLICWLRKKKEKNFTDCFNGDRNS